MPFTTHNGNRIYWRLEGRRDRPAVVFLHGIGTGLSLFDRVVPLLLDTCCLVRVDLRGHGASDAPAGDYTLDQLAGDVLAVLDDAGLDRAILCGLSLGGMVAMELVLKAPERVSGLILSCTSATMPDVFWQNRIDAVREHGLASIADLTLERQYSPQFRASNPDWVASSRHILQTMDSNGYAGCGAAIRDMDVFPRLGSVTVPTLVVSGTFDLATPHAGNGDRIAAAIPGATTVLLDTGHLASMEDPEGYSEAVRQLVTKASPV